ncbi:MAG: DNA polymerase IV, partial [Oscillospiraceae bacterium]|nr:DNA polymerase IV [Oscillospiraceae bacterium]
MDRTILHCDCNGFYASVECVLNPELRNVPMAVGGDEESRHGIILAKNEKAKKFNIQTAETIWQAKKKCPDLVIVSPHHDLYHKYSKQVMDIYKRYTDYVEPFGLDEAWLDVTGSKRLFGDGVTIADTLRKTVKEETGLTISVGVSFCKVFAKLGSDYKKPDATTVFSKDNWREFIYPLSVRDLLYVGRRTGDELEKLGVKTIGELAAFDEKTLVSHLGKAGAMLRRYANGLDNDRVKSIYEKEEIKSIGNGITFSQDLLGEGEVRGGIYALSDSIAARMRRKKLKCTTVQVMIKDPQFKTISRQRKLDYPTYTSRDIREAAMDIVRKSWNFKLPIRMMSVTGMNLIGEDDIYEQVSLFEESREQGKKVERFEKTVDSLKSRFGDSVYLGGDIKKYEKN